MDTRDGTIYSDTEFAALSEPDRQYLRPMEVHPTPAQRKARKVGRNDGCPCGSGRKFKKCCMVGA